MQSFEECMGTVNLQLKIIFGLHSSCMEGRVGYRSGISPNHWIPGRGYAFIGKIQNSASDPQLMLTVDSLPIKF